MIRIMVDTDREVDNVIEGFESVTPYAKRHTIQDGTEYLDQMGNSLGIVRSYGDEIHGYTVTIE